MLLDLGADTGLNLDGGGSTTLVARPLGGTSATLRNTPSDGSERADPTGVGLFVSPGDGKVDTPRRHAPRSRASSPACTAR